MANIFKDVIDIGNEILNPLRLKLFIVTMNRDKGTYCIHIGRLDPSSLATMIHIVQHEQAVDISYVIQHIHTTIANGVDDNLWLRKPIGILGLIYDKY